MVSFFRTFCRDFSLYKMGRLLQNAYVTLIPKLTMAAK